MIITLEMYNTKYSVETQNDDCTAEELIEIFSRILVAAGYSPDVIINRDGSKYKVEVVTEE